MKYPVPDHHVDIIRVHCLWLRQLEEQLWRVGLDYEARKARAALIAVNRLLITIAYEI
jgi:hypothetical protein